MDNRVVSIDSLPRRPRRKFVTVVDTVSTTHITPTTTNQDLNILKGINLQDMPIDSSLYQCITNSSQKSKTTIVKVERIEVPTGKEGLKIPVSLVHEDGIFGLLLVCFLLFSSFYKGGRLMLKEHSRLLFSSRRTPNLFDETTVSDFWYNFISIFQTILLIATILFSYFWRFNSNVTENKLLVILEFIISIYLLIGLRYLIYRIVGFVFDLKSFVLGAFRNDIVLTEMIGIIAFIPALILLYSDSYDNLMFIFLAALFVISRLIYIYRLSIDFLEEKVSYLFLIAYLCTVEILPYVFLYEALMFLYEHDLINVLL